MLPKISIHIEELGTQAPISPEWQIEHVLSSPGYVASLRFNGKTIEEIEMDVTSYTLDWAWNKCALFVQLAQAAFVQATKGFPILIYYSSNELHHSIFSFKGKPVPEWRYVHVPIIPIPLIDTVRSWGHEPMFWTSVLKEGFLEMPSEGEEIPAQQMHRLFADGIIEYWMCQQIEDFDMLIHYPSKSIDDIRKLLESTLIEEQ